jgi:hypothetical protein
MKNFLTVLMLFGSLTSLGQQHNPKLKTIKKIMVGSPPKSTFNKEFDATKSEYYFDNVVKVKNGHDEDVDVKVTGSVPVKAWSKYVNHLSDEIAFVTLVHHLSLEAQYQLKNPLSFEPMKTQFFMWYEKDSCFVCIYKYMGRNGYGNMIEGESIVQYKPGK